VGVWVIELKLIPFHHPFGGDLKLSLEGNAIDRGSSQLKKLEPSVHGDRRILC